MRAGLLRHRVTFQTLEPAAQSVSSITRSGLVATVTLLVAHGFATDDRVTIAGASQSAYNGTAVITVASTTVFTYAVSGSPSTPATGTITATYVSDRLGAKRRIWRDLMTVWGWCRALSGRERIGSGQVASEVTHAINVRYRSTITPKLRAVVDGKFYEVESVLDLDGRKRALTLMCAHRQDLAA